MNKGSKLLNIEFIRVLLTISIVLFHMRIHLNYLHQPLYTWIYSAFESGRNAVEGFFILSGLFLILTFNKDISLKTFIQKKYIRLSPVILFSISLLIISWSMGCTHLRLFGDFLSVLLLNNFGMYWTIGSNVVLWYTSALFFGLLVYFCILKYTKNKSTTIIIILTILNYLILNFTKNGYFGGYDTIYYTFLSIGTCRSIAGIGLGCCVGLLYQKHKNIWTTKSLNYLSTTFFSLLEVSCLVYICWYLFYPHEFIYHIIFVLIFTVLLLLFLYNKGILSNFFNKNFWSKISKYSYSIFVTHYIIIKFLYNYYWKTHKQFIAQHPILPIIIDILAVIILGIITYHLIEKPSIKILTNLNARKGKKCLI